MIDASSEWLIGRYSETIIKYSLLFNISFIEIMINFKEKYDRLVTNLEDEMINGEIIFTMFASSVITLFRKKLGEEVISDILVEGNKLQKLENIDDKILRNIFMEKLVDRFSIILNIKTINVLAMITDRQGDNEKYIENIYLLLDDVDENS